MLGAGQPVTGRREPGSRPTWVLTPQRVPFTSVPPDFFQSEKIEIGKQPFMLPQKRNGSQRLK